MVYYEHRDGRICIAFNHAGASMVGSTDIRIDDPDEAVCLEDEKRYMLGALAGVFPGSGDHGRRDRACLHRGEAAAGERGRGDRADQPRPSGECGAGRAAALSGADADRRQVDDVSRLRRGGGGRGAWRSLGVERTVDTSGLAIGGGRGFPADAAKRAPWVREEAKAAGLPEERFALLAAALWQPGGRGGALHRRGAGRAAGFCAGFFAPRDAVPHQQRARAPHRRSSASPHHAWH